MSTEASPTAPNQPRPEWTTIADDEAIRFLGASYQRYDSLQPDTEYVFDGETIRTLPRRGELLCRFATVNDVHFGETVCGHIDGLEGLQTFRVDQGAAPYPEVMNAGAVEEIAAINPSTVVVKGDLTSKGTLPEYERFLEVYGGAFGDRLLHVRGNHESFHGLTVASSPFQERVLDGVTIVLLDTSRDGRTNGDLSADQLEQLDEAGARTTHPVLVMGHHPVWNPAEEQRLDTTFHLVPDATDALAAVMHRRRSLLGYFAGHTHRNRVVYLPDAGSVPFVEVACVKDFPGSWAEYRVFEGNILQVHRRISTTAALEWSERTRGMFWGTYPRYALGRRSHRCFEIPIP
ncbi:MAG: metallophosphoesterase family protein [Actinomycetes bacterium]